MKKSLNPSPIMLDMSRTAKILSTEAGVWKSLQAATTKMVHWTRIEARVGAGIPDLNGAMTDLEFWLELKVVKTVSFKTEGLWRPGQVAWQMKRAASMTATAIMKDAISARAKTVPIMPLVGWS